MEYLINEIDPRQFSVVITSIPDGEIMKSMLMELFQRFMERNNYMRIIDLLRDEAICSRISTLGVFDDMDILRPLLRDGNGKFKRPEDISILLGELLDNDSFRTRFTSHPLTLQAFAHERLKTPLLTLLQDDSLARSLYLSSRVHPCVLFVTIPEIHSRFMNETYGRLIIISRDDKRYATEKRCADTWTFILSMLNAK
uniref:Uncharacterized protein n=1 Tax=viral metagenome TaxID=1070528 RepID=A0A6C0BKQ4_9ZZZZ